jgi:heat shock protein HslJ
MRLAPLTALILLAPACAPVGAPSSSGATAAPYHAVGTEPGWALTIGDGAMRYQGDYGETRIAVSTPEPRTSFNGHRYETERLTVDITHTPCSDGMSDRRYPDTVMVVADGKTVHGCGGAAAVSGMVALAGTEWSIASINGAPPAAARKAAVRFTGTRISGNAGCNSFGGSYTLDGNMLTVGPVISTKMACMGPGMSQESAVFKILQQPMTVVAREDGSLALSSDAGTMTLTPDTTPPSP